MTDKNKQTPPIVQVPLNRPSNQPQRVPAYDSVHSNNRRNDTTVQQTQPTPPPPKR